MAAINPPGSTAIVEVADEHVEEYAAQGWTLAGAQPERKYLSQMNKAELVARANELGLDADESLAKKDLLELIESAEAEQE